MVSFGGAQQNPVQQVVAALREQLSESRAQTAFQRSRAERDERVITLLEGGNSSGSGILRGIVSIDHNIGHPPPARRAHSALKAAGSYAPVTRRSRPGLKPKTGARSMAEPVTFEAVAEALSVSKQHQARGREREPASAGALSIAQSAGRNSPCPCGSGKKYKRCCVAGEAAVQHCNAGNALWEQGQLAEAAAQYRAAVRLKPDYVKAHHNLGGVLLDLGAPREAVEHYRATLRLRPDYAQAHYNLGRAWQSLGNLPEAVTGYHTALRLRPDLVHAHWQLVLALQHLCDWSQLEDLWAQSRALLHAQPPSALIPNPMNVLAMPSSAAEQLTAARNAAAHYSVPLGRVRADRGFHFTFTPQPKATLRVGYLSTDFRAHATSSLIAEVLELHDRTRVEVWGYSIGGADGSPMRQRLARAFDRCVELQSASVGDAARRIFADGIDILVDLKGYTTGARTEILAYRPAPIQVNYLGYPGTMGADFMDYIITDRFLTPPAQQPYFTERFVYLPDTYQPNDRQRPIAVSSSSQTPSRAACGLPDQGFVFCSLGSAYKITPGMFDLWMRLLHATPGSVLWLLGDNEWAMANLQRTATDRGVAAERLVFAARKPLAEHLARYRLADLFLDTLPVNGHTTTSDALWTGLPVLTCAGDTFVARVAGSLLQAIDLPELVTTSLEDYECLALRLAHNPDELARLRAKLAANRDTTPLFDSVRYTRHLEAAYQQMWATLCEGARAPDA